MQRDANTGSLPDLDYRRDLPFANRLKKMNLSVYKLSTCIWQHSCWFSADIRNLKLDVIFCLVRSLPMRSLRENSIESEYSTLQMVLVAYRVPFIRKIA